MAEITNMQNFDENDNPPHLATTSTSISDSNLNDCTVNDSYRTVLKVGLDTVNSVESTNFNFSETVCQQEGLSIKVSSGAEFDSQGVPSCDSSELGCLSETNFTENKSTVPEESNLFSDDIEINESLNHSHNRDLSAVSSNCNPAIEVECILPEFGDNTSGDTSSDQMINMTDVDLTAMMEGLSINESNLCNASAENPSFPVPKFHDSDKILEENMCYEVPNQICDHPKTLKTAPVSDEKSLESSPCKGLNASGDSNIQNSLVEQKGVNESSVEILDKSKCESDSFKACNQTDCSTGKNSPLSSPSSPNNYPCKVPDVYKTGVDSFKTCSPVDNSNIDLAVSSSLGEGDTISSKGDVDPFGMYSLLDESNTENSGMISAAEHPTFKIPNISDEIFKLPKQPGNNSLSSSVEVDTGRRDSIYKSPNQSDPFVDAEEEFTDAVQFFKDPTSFQYLENAKSSQTESNIPRSSLYVTFDPLYSNLSSQQRSAPDSLHLISSAVKGTLNEPSDCNEKMVGKHLVDIASRESIGNILISFDSPKASNKVKSCVNVPTPISDNVPKMYTEEELQQAVKVHELAMQEIFLKRQREMEEELLKLKDDGESKIVNLSNLCKSYQATIEELLCTVTGISNSKEVLQFKQTEVLNENEKLKNDLKTAMDDCQSVESTFSDFHKRYEQCKGMLKSYKENEEKLKQNLESLNNKLVEEEQKYSMLLERTQEMTEKANGEVASVKKTNEAQVMVLKAQLKKAELKISGLESDLKQIKIENSQLGGICDDLMAKVNEA